MSTDRAQRIAAVAQTGEDRILLARVYERLAAAQRRGIPAATCFLSPREQAMTRQLLPGLGLMDYGFFGGHPSAERQVCHWLPEWCEEDWLTGEESPLVLFRASFSPQDSLTHRDFLGSLMGAGVKRETVGDIYVGQGSCDFLVLREIAPYIGQNLTSAGRTRLSLQELPLAQLAVPAQELQTVQETLAALRLDCVVAAGFRLSRARAADQIEAGRVSLNHLPVLKPDRAVAEGDTVSLQGHGKLRLAQVRGNTKKGRIAVTLERYR